MEISAEVYRWHNDHRADADYTRRARIDCRLANCEHCAGCACPCHEARRAARERVDFIEACRRRGYRP